MPSCGPTSNASRRGVGGLGLYDAHTHVGANDPDGFTQTPEQLLKALAPAEARGVVFPMHEPGGYREANDFVIDAAAASEGVVVPYCRVDPRDSASPRPRARWTRARAGSSCTRARSSSASTCRPCASSSRSRTSAACPC